MRLLYRADGGHPIGTGHVYRAVRIINQLSKFCELDAVLVVGDTEPARQIAESAGAQILLTEPSFGPESIKPRFHYDSVRSLMEGGGFDLIAIDMLDTEASEMARLSEFGTPIITFDDRGEGCAWATAAINTLVTERVMARENMFGGPSYAVLDPLYGTARGTFPFCEGPVERVFVSLGGGDAAGLSVKVANALRPVDGIRRVEFGVGPAFKHREALDAARSSAPWESEVFTSLPNLLDRYLNCDLAIVAGGLTMYEVCCVGAPALAVCQPIDHQLELAELLAAAGAMATVGYGLQASEERIANEVAEVSRNLNRRRAFSQKGPDLVDGKGVERVARIFLQIGDGCE